MWDSNTPLQLINSMPKKLGKEHLERLQMIIEADKYKNSLLSGFELCGMYAPFCNGCDKSEQYPCAIAYVNMLNNEGRGFEIEGKEKQEVAAVEEVAVAEDLPVDMSESEQIETIEEAQPEEVEPSVVTEDVEASEVADAVEEQPEEVPVAQPVKKIRIAVARKRLSR